MFFTVSDPNRHAPAGMLCMLPFILLREVDFSICPSNFLKKKVMADNFMGPSVWSFTPVRLFLLGCSGSLGVLAGHIVIVFFNSPL